MEENTHPQYLYKILSCENWKTSQNLSVLKLSEDDKDFIHFSTEDQLERIVNKYWANVPQYIILRISTAHLFGNLVFEANPGGTSNYYHLYNGAIPMKSIVGKKEIGVVAHSHRGCSCKNH